MLLVVLENECNLKMLLCYVRKTLQCVPSTVGDPFSTPKEIGSSPGSKVRFVSSWRNGYVICKDLDLSSTYDQWNFSPVKRFLQSNPNVKICTMCPNNIAYKLSSGTYVK